MKKNFCLAALFIFQMVLSVAFVNNVFAQECKNCRSDRSLIYNAPLGVSSEVAKDLLGGTAPSLGTAASFAVLGSSTVTNAGPSIITGNVGVSPGIAITGFPPGTMVGTPHTGDAEATQAHADLVSAYNDLTAQVCNTNISGTDLNVLTRTPGTYCFNTSAQLTGTLILDAQNDSNAVFIFQIGSTLTTASNSSVILINGAKACNVFFQVGSSATLGTGTSFYGNIIALTSNTLSSGASLGGRALSINGAVTMDTNNITVCNRPSAANVSVSGRVTDNNGHGISRALIRMTDGTGVVTMAYTGSFGYYNFDNVGIGQILILEVFHKRYNFTESTKVVNLGDLSQTVDFIAD